ncbi:MAG: ATP-dependent DNA ligase [Bryobacteraceae bacterium]|nr:ATP-dependent DNA ligase [Bryobacterales bacterium]NUN00979.1 ATP-dependent DNA ligase [Bryobacteraceae bacterium]
MLLSRVVETSRKVAETSKRLEKLDLLARLVRQLTPDEAEIVIPFLSGTTRQGRIGIGYATLRDAASPPAEDSSLEIAEVARIFEEIARVAGRGAERQKQQLLHSLLSRSTQAEQRFLTALLMGELRQGALQALMVEAVAKAAGIAPEHVRRAVMVAGGVVPVAQAVLSSGEAGLARFSIELFRPVQPMLAQTAEDIDEAVACLGEAALEFKLDGVRIQAHKSGSDVVVFSRRLNDVTVAVPEVVEAVRMLPAQDLILDGEVLSLQPGGRPQPFQITMRRFGRKLDVGRMRAELPLQPFWFDLLHINGTDMTEEPQARRFTVMRELAPQENVIPQITTADSAAARDFLLLALKHGHEGIMAKALNAPYAAGKRGQGWLKVKPARTLDLVILAAEWGHGRRRGWLSNLHLGARDTKQGGYAMLGKTFKGLTDAMLSWQTQELLKFEIGRDEYTVYVEPKLVVEIAFNEIQISPRYPSGLALRFARVKRYRPDKSATETDTLQTVRAWAGLQAAEPPGDNGHGS